MGEEEKEVGGSEEAFMKGNSSMVVVQGWQPVLPGASESSDSDNETPRQLKGSPERKPGLGLRQISTSSSRSALSPNNARTDECHWTRRRCAFMHIKVGGKITMDNPAELSDLAQVISSLVVAVKKHGATIDRVGLETIVVHWGQSSHVAEAAMKAVLAAMEAQQAAAETFASLRSQLWLSIGIGHGWCHLATLSASGHRFYVSAGPEIKLATQVAYSEVGRRCKCDVLISSNVKQEVHYRIRCSPRVWVGNVLMWEPVALVQECEADEWMYQLQKMDERSNVVAMVNAMAAVFASIPSSPPLSTVEAAVAGLKARYGDGLTPHDIASLDLLLATLSSQCLVTVDL
eukprot:GGOE01056968.1.p1 GENE.GGOE01056968.1~~GGOE01056968.1.p1  ORF type:complete len:407 (+),score=126.20 GGOE01056968.1:184-1221(+)